MRLVLLVLGCLGLALPAAAQGEWTLNESVDQMTDEAVREVCAEDTAGQTICFQFLPERSSIEMFVTLVSPSESMDVYAHRRYPLLRVDSGYVYNTNDMLAENLPLLGEDLVPHENHSTWMRWQAQDAKHPRFENVGIYKDLLNGQTLRIRAFIHGGFQRDSTVSLEGLAPILRDLYQKALADAGVAG